MSLLSDGASNGARGKESFNHQNQVYDPSMANHDRHQLAGNENVDYSSLFMTAECWHDRESMIAWARSKAQKYGMILTVLKLWESSEERFGLVYLACEKHESFIKEEESVVDEEDDQTLKTQYSSFKKNGCPFMLHGFEAVRNVWRLEVACGVHNHTLPQNLTGPVVSRPLTNKQFNGVQKTQAATQMLNSNENNLTSLQQIHSLEMGDTSWNQKLFTMLTRGRYCYRWRLSDSKKLKDLAFTHPEWLKLWNKFPYIMIMNYDAFKTNKYNMPLLEVVGMTCTEVTFHLGFVFMAKEDEDTYDWMMSTVVRWSGNNPPKVIMTNGEHGLLKNIPKSFPNAHHMLCKTHVIDNIAKHAKNLLSVARQQEFVQECKILFKSESKELFETRYRDMSARWERGITQYLSEKWICHREKIVNFLTDQHFRLGIRTTKRAKAVHTNLEQHVRTCNGLFDSCFEVIVRMLVADFRQVWDSLQQSHFRISSEVRRFPIFSLLLGRVSDNCLKRLHTAFMEVSKGEYSKECKNCYVRSSFGLPCTHEVARIMYEERRSFCEKDVHEFWLQVQQYGQKLNHGNGPTGIDMIANEKLRKETMGQSEWPPTDGKRRRVMATDQRQVSIVCDDINTQRRRQVSSSFIVGGYDFGQDNFERFMIPFVIHVENVTNDGNSGFRALAVLLGKSEHAWSEIVSSMLRETAAHPKRYTPLLRGTTMTDFNLGLHSVYKGVSAPDTFSMDMTISGALFATIYQCTLVYLDWLAAHTSIPLARQPPAPGAPPPNSVLVLCRDRLKNRFLAAVFSPGFPMPPILTDWYSIRDRSVARMDQQYTTRIQMFRNLRHSHGRPPP